MNDEIRLVLSRRQLQAAGAFLLLVASSYALHSETLVLSTFYPSPAGIFGRLISSGNALLAVNAGTRVGIGTSAPQGKLDVGDGQFLVSEWGEVSMGGSARVLGDLAVERTLQLGGSGLQGTPAGREGALYFDAQARSFLGFQDGAWARLGGGTGFTNMGVFDADGRFRTPPGVSRIMVELWGAGGGGAGGASCHDGGGGGGYGRSILPVSSGREYSVIVGRGGAGGDENGDYNSRAGWGGNGGASSFSGPIDADDASRVSIHAYGGMGGKASDFGDAPVRGGASDAQVRIEGQDGQRVGQCAGNYGYDSGGGGSSPNGGAGGTASHQGRGNAKAPGGGGAGATVTSSTKRGGDGAAGRVIIWW
ncbi:MAG: hypothetical protein HY554_00705 [Elusimicrobia bacterium]|nr:hypothetical protein [Elusimicrobiota bacterium]